MGIFAGARTLEVIDATSQVVAQSWRGSGPMGGWVPPPPPPPPLLRAPAQPRVAFLHVRHPAAHFRFGMTPFFSPCP
jgi:hypothetical protein